MILLVIFIDLDVACCRLGRFPLVRRVIGYLYGYAVTDFDVPGFRVVNRRMYHVNPSDAVVQFSEVASALMFSESRIGGISNEDNIVRMNQGVSTFVQLCRLVV